MNFDIKRWDGQPISEPGVYVGIPIDAYHQQLTVGPSISSSGLRTIFHDSPRAYIRTSYLNPMRKPETPSKPFIFGRAAHHLLLGESEFRKHFIVRPETCPDHGKTAYQGDPETAFCGFWADWPKKPWNANDLWCKAWLAGAAKHGLIVLSPNDIEMIRSMADMLAAEPLVQAGILSGLIEHSFVWRDEETGIWLKWRPDALPTDNLDFADLKTCASVDDSDLERNVPHYGYHAQAGLGLMACRDVLGQPLNSFSLVLVEKETYLPCVRVKEIKMGDIEMGMRQNRVSLKWFKNCLDTGKWPGPGGEQTDAEYLHLNPHAMTNFAMRIEYLESSLG